MSSKDETRKMRKVNMRIFPTYKKLGWDYLFFYTIDFLFLTQVKNISAADVVLKSTFYAIFSSIMQIPANIIVEFLGRKNSIVLGNILNCFYMVVIMLSRNLGDLVFAEFISATAFAIKELSEPSLLNESIPPSKYKSKIFAKINSKGASGFYLFNAISKAIAGFLFAINGYIPIVCSLVVLILVSILSVGFIEPVRRKKKNIDELLDKKQLKDMRDGFSFILKSERLKALILCSSLIVSLIMILGDYTISLLEDLKLSSIIIGIIGAAGSYISSYASKEQENFHNKFRNKSLILIAMMISVSSLIGGICGLKAEQYVILLVIVILMNLVYYFGEGIYFTIIDKYLRNFASKDIDTKIFAVNNLISNVFRAIGCFFASFLLDKMNTAYCMIIIGIIYTILYLLLAKYMKTRIGLKPEEYSEEEIKYDEQKQMKIQENINI